MNINLPISDTESITITKSNNFGFNFKISNVQGDYVYQK